MSKYKIMHGENTQVAPPLQPPLQFRAGDKGATATAKRKRSQAAGEMGVVEPSTSSPLLSLLILVFYKR